VLPRGRQQADGLGEIRVDVDVGVGGQLGQAVQALEFLDPLAERLLGPFAGGDVGVDAHDGDNPPFLFDRVGTQKNGQDVSVLSIHLHFAGPFLSTRNRIEDLASDLTIQVNRAGRIVPDVPEHAGERLVLVIMDAGRRGDSDGIGGVLQGVLESLKIFLGPLAGGHVAQNRLDGDGPAVLDDRLAGRLDGERVAVQRLMHEFDGAGFVLADGPPDDLAGAAAVLVRGDEREEVAADDVLRVGPGELLHGRAAIRQGAVGRKGDDDVALVFGQEAIAGLAVTQGLLGPPLVGDVADGLDGADDLAPAVAQRTGRAPEDRPAGTEIREIHLRGHGIAVALEFLVQGFGVGGAEGHVDEHRPALAVEREGVGVVAPADHLVGGPAAQVLHGPVPGDDGAGAVDHHGGVRQERDDLPELLLGTAEPGLDRLHRRPPPSNQLPAWQSREESTAGRRRDRARLDMDVRTRGLVWRGPIPRAVPSQRTVSEDAP